MDQAEKNKRFVDRLKERGHRETEAPIPDGMFSTRSILSILAGTDDTLRPNLDDYSSITGVLKHLNLPHDEANFYASIATAKKYLYEALPWTQEIAIPEGVKELTSDQKIEFTDQFMKAAEEQYGKAHALPEFTAEMREKMQSEPAVAVPVQSEAPDENTMSRGHFLFITAMGLAAACTKRVSLPATPYVVKRFANLGKSAVFYAKLDGTAPPDRTTPLSDSDKATLKTNLESYDSVVVQPYFIGPNDLKNGKGYFSLTSLVEGAPGTQKLWDDILNIKDANGNPIKDASGNIVGGFLLDANNNVKLDPTLGNNPPPRMVDLRNPAARKLMTDFGVGIISSYPQGGFADSMDAAVTVENDGFVVTYDNTTGAITNITPPAVQHYLGYTEAARETANDIAVAAYKASGHNMTVGGALQKSFALAYTNKNYNEESIIDTLLAASCQISEEDQFELKSGVPRTAADNEYTVARYTALANRVKAFNATYVSDPTKYRDHTEILVLEPVDTLGQTAADFKDTAQKVGKFYGPMLQKIYQDTGYPLTASIFIGNVYPTGPSTAYFDFANSDAIKENALLRGQEANLGLVKNNHHEFNPSRRNFLKSFMPANVRNALDNGNNGVGGIA